MTGSAVRPALPSRGATGQTQDATMGGLDAVEAPTHGR
jgi:hypothetical protein